MRKATIIVSLLLHAVVALGALQVRASKHKHKATTVAVVGEKKKAEDKPKPPPPPPPPPPKVAAKAPPKAPEPTAAPAPAAVASSTAPPPPMESGLELSNTGPGLDIGPQEIKPKGDQPKADQPKPSPVKPPPTPKKTDDGAGAQEAACTEEPTKPEPTAKTEIEYTDKARQDGIEGRMVLKVTVDANGAVANVEVVASVDPSLDAAAVAAVKQWRFKPSYRCGKPVAGGTFTIARRFELGD